MKHSYSKVIVRAFLCNPPELSNNINAKFIMCLVHKSVECSCEDMETHPIKYDDVPPGQGYGFEWQFNLSKFQRMFFTNNKLTVRLRIIQLSADNANENTPVNNQVIKSFAEKDDCDEANSVVKNYAKLINDPSADFRIEVEDGRAVRVHKIILQAQWPYFRNMLNSHMIEAVNNKVVAVGHDYDTILAMITFLYSGDMNIQSVEHSLKLYRAAHQYDIQRMRSMAKSYLSRNLKLDQLFEVLVYADHFNCQDIKEVCLRKLVIHKRYNGACRLENYPNYDKLRSYERFQGLITEILTSFFNEAA